MTLVQAIFEVVLAHKLVDAHAAVRLIFSTGLIFASVIAILTTHLGAQRTFNPEAFEWPRDAYHRLLAYERNSSPEVEYEDGQIDEFMANAMLHFIRGARGKARAPTEQKNPHSLDAVVRDSSFRKLHVHSTPSLDFKYHGGHNRRWFSLPLLDADYRDPYLLRPHQVISSVPGGSKQSLDLIRFDRYYPHLTEGFWLPTAIVRPYYAVNKALKSDVLYEFPTSYRTYVESHRDDPRRAAKTLKDALQQKQDIWLRKLKDHERTAMKAMWSRAPSSKLFLKYEEEHDLDRGSVGESSRRAVTSRAPSSSFAVPPTLDAGPFGHPGQAHPPHFLGYMSHGSSSRSAYAAAGPRREAATLTEHDFLGPRWHHTELPKAQNPWQPAYHPGGGPNHSGWQNQQDEPGLDLSL